MTLESSVMSHSVFSWIIDFVFAFEAELFNIRQFNVVINCHVLSATDFRHKLSVALSAGISVLAPLLRRNALTYLYVLIDVTATSQESFAALRTGILSNGDCSVFVLVNLLMLTNKSGTGKLLTADGAKKETSD